MADGIIDPKNKKEADAAQSGTDWANSIGDAAVKAKDTVSSGFSAIGDWFSGMFSGDDAGDGGDAGADGKKKKFKWGNGIGGLLGVLGAYLLSNIFGGGILGTIMFALFIIPAFMMGRSQLGSTISGWIGEEPSKPKAVQASELNVAQAPTMSGVANGVNNPAALPPTPQQALQADVMEVAQKTQIARVTVGQLAQTGEINAGRVRYMMEDIGRAEQMVQQMQSVDIARLNEEQLRAITREFSQADAAMDRTISSNPIVAAQVQQGMTPSVAAPPAGPVFVGNNTPNTIVGVVPPEAQLQLMAMRQNGQNYQYAPAQQNTYAAQQFTGLPDQQPYMVANPYAQR